MPIGPEEDPNRFEDFDACVASISDSPGMDQESAERVCGKWQERKKNANDDDGNGDEDRGQSGGVDAGYVAGGLRSRE